MKNAGALQSIMSGSGPTVFGVFEEQEMAQKAADEIRAKNLSDEVYLSSFQN